MRELRKHLQVKLIQHLSVWIAIVASFSTQVAAESTRTCTYDYFQRLLPFRGRNILVEFYRPKGSGTFPLVLLLHGTAGAYTPRTFKEPPMENFGEKALARDCFTTALPHYLEAMGLSSLTSPQQISEHFPELVDASDALLKQVEEVSSAANEPVFLFGESLGGFLSIALASRHREVLAISEFGGGLPPGLSVNLSHIHGLLISHGSKDALVPAAKAIELDQYCVDHHIPVQMHLYWGEGHYLSPPVQMQIVTGTAIFFRTLLNPKHGARDP